VCKVNNTALGYNGVDIFNCGSSKAISFNDLVKCINNCLGTNLEPEYIDNPFEPTYQNFIQCDMKKTNSMLPYKFTDSLQSIKDYISTLPCTFPD
jgi:nucleoside-diphosphate-sugar epimerase